MITYMDSSVDYLSEGFLYDRTQNGWRTCVYQAMIFPVASTGIFRNKAIKRIFCHLPEFKRCLRTDLKRDKPLKPGMLLYGSSRIQGTWNRLNMVAVAVRQNVDDCSQYEYIEEGLKAIRKDYESNRYCADMKLMLPLDTFSEGLDVNILKEIVENVFSDFSREIVVVMP